MKVLRITLPVSQGRTGTLIKRLKIDLGNARIGNMSHGSKDGCFRGAGGAIGSHPG